MDPPPPRAPSQAPGRSTTTSTVPNDADTLGTTLAADASAQKPDTAKTGSALHAILAMAAVSIAPSAWGSVFKPSIVPVLGATSRAPLFERELLSPLPHDFVWPRFERFAFFEHHGSFRDEWGVPACSVADRPTDAPPLPGNYHFIMDVFDFLLLYPYPVLMHTSSVPCTCTAYANASNWKRHVDSGEMWRTCESFLLMLYIGGHAACEHAHSMLQYVVGDPSFRTTTQEHGDPDNAIPVRYKSFLFWLRGLSPVPPSHHVPERLQLPRASHPDPKVRMLLHSAFPKPLAEAHVRVWAADLTGPSNTPVPARAYQVSAGYSSHRDAIW